MQFNAVYVVCGFENLRLYNCIKLHFGFMQFGFELMRFAVLNLCSLSGLVLLFSFGSKPHTNQSAVLCGPCGLCDYIAKTAHAYLVSLQ